ncbi:hypothetical protein RvY_12609 [Ramazzottius varieornatus]|uniref:Uncharacterized protein n=1 Tax=Ramazzottius varieornatus TaxID=947166 RepID=A0A1D1VK51_RAMVA|nr:hypothetical protein RvY_12609 [Ramazzottius varieornatus]
MAYDQIVQESILKFLDSKGEVERDYNLCQTDPEESEIILNVFVLDKYITTVCSCCLKVHHRDLSLPFPSSFNSSQIYKCLRSDTGV